MFISYIGTRYHGWQFQDNAVTIQGVIEDKLKLLFKQKIVLAGSSRTDTGVHALKQCAHFDIPFEINPQQICYKLNMMLPTDVSIVDIFPVDESKNARFSAVSRTYNYVIVKNKNPFIHAYCCTRPLNIEKMNYAAQILMKYNDFETFSKVGTISKHGYSCNLIEAQWNIIDDKIVFQITANRFLRGMVRAIVGNMLYVGLGKMDLDRFEEIIQRQDRSLSRGLAPATGLTLVNVSYKF